MKRNFLMDIESECFDTVKLLRRYLITIYDNKVIIDMVVDELSKSNDIKHKSKLLHTCSLITNKNLLLMLNIKPEKCFDKIKLIIKGMKLCGGIYHFRLEDIPEFRALVLIHDMQEKPENAERFACILSTKENCMMCNAYRFLRNNTVKRADYDASCKLVFVDSIKWREACYEALIDTKYNEAVEFVRKSKEKGPYYFIIIANKVEECNYVLSKIKNSKVIFIRNDYKYTLNQIDKKGVFYDCGYDDDQEQIGLYGDFIDDAINKINW